MGFTELGVAGIFILMVLDRVFGFVIKMITKRNHNPGNPSELTQILMALTRIETLIKGLPQK